MSTHHRLAASATVVLTVVLPVAIGTAATVAISAGLISFSGSPVTGDVAWVALWQQPGVYRSLGLSVFTAVAGAALALLIAATALYATRRFVSAASLQSTLPVLLSVPHAAFAIGLAFLVAPSGWIARLVSPALTGWTRPPDIATVQDGFGLALTLGLALKEAPFLMLVLLAALNQVDHRRTLWIGRSLGYDEWQLWWRLLMPQLYRQIRLPLLVVLAYGLSVVDMARILGPSVPPTFAVQVTQWLSDPDIAKWPIGTTGALVLAATTALLAGLAVGLERALSRTLRVRRTDGVRARPLARRLLGVGLPTAALVLTCGALAVIVLWSLTWRWRFPSAFPDSISTAFWVRNLDAILAPALNTLVLAGASSALALVLSVALLESYQRLPRVWLPALYAPLLLPQLTFLFGIQSVLAYWRLDGKLVTVVWVHTVFVLPYTLLALAGYWQAYDQRLSTVSRTLSKRAWQTALQVKLPMLFRPLCFALAIGFSVSVAQYLSTLFVGAGRVPTLTTEAVGIAAGGDRRLVAVLAFVQMALPLALFALAFALPAWRHRHREGMRL
ncbi:MAG: ABC transporter permease [Pseudomonadota bacterium]